MSDDLKFVSDVIEEATQLYSMGRQPIDGNPDDHEMVPGRFLCWVLRDLAVSRFDADALNVLHGWGIHSTGDIGRVVRQVDGGNQKNGYAPSEFIDHFNFDTAFSWGGNEEVECIAHAELHSILEYVENRRGDLTALLKNLNLVFQLASRLPSSQPTWRLVGQMLHHHAEGLDGPDRHARHIIDITFDCVLSGYLEFHGGILYHQTDRELFNPFFVGFAIDSVMKQDAGSGSPERVSRDALETLSDFIGHHPVPCIEGQEIRSHASGRVRPVPLYVRGAGVAMGRYRELVEIAVPILEQIDGDLSENFFFDPARLFELAYNPREYDVSHPADNRPNYQFGIWDPDSIDEQGYYKRCVIQQITLESIQRRIDDADPDSRTDHLLEAGATLAGITLMASGLCGNRPDTYESGQRLSDCLARIAHSRDAFYDRLLTHCDPGFAKRLAEHSANRVQSFGGARQDLNRRLSENRTRQRTHWQLADIFARLDDTGAVKKHGREAGTAEAHWRFRIRCGLIELRQHSNANHFAAVSSTVSDVIDLLKKGIECGALVNPWNIAGFDGMYPIFKGKEDEVYDCHCDELVLLANDIFRSLTDLWCRLSIHGDRNIASEIATIFDDTATWWDGFQTTQSGNVGSFLARDLFRIADEASSVLQVRHSGSAEDSVERMVQALQSDDGFSLAIKHLTQSDEDSSVPLLLSWLGRATDSPESRRACCQFIKDWLPGFLQTEDPDEGPGTSDPAVASRFREEKWPILESILEWVRHDYVPDDFSETLKHPIRNFNRLSEYLEHQRCCSHIYRVAAPKTRYVEPAHGTEAQTARFSVVASQWVQFANAHQQRIDSLLNQVSDLHFEVNLDDRLSRIAHHELRLKKDAVLSALLHTSVELEATSRLVMAIHGANASAEPESLPQKDIFGVDILSAIIRSDIAPIRQHVSAAIAEIETKPLLYVPLNRGGHPAAVFEVLNRQRLIQELLVCLPRVGLLTEAIQIVVAVEKNEKNNPVGKGAVTVFDEMFEIGMEELLRSLISAAKSWSDNDLRTTAEEVTESMMPIWLRHSRTLRLSILEKVFDERSWNQLVAFIKRYGNELFSQHFMAIANLRSILRLGVDVWLGTLEENPRGELDFSLLDEIDEEFPRQVVIDSVTLAMEAVVENYDEYRDYNRTTTQSDSGSCLYMFLELLRLRARYDRIVWNLKPVNLTQEVLLQSGRIQAAELWRRSVEDRVHAPAEEHAASLHELENRHRLHIGTIRSRILEKLTGKLETNHVRHLVHKAWHGGKDNRDESRVTELENYIDQRMNQQATGEQRSQDWLEAVSDELEKCENESGRMINRELRELLPPIPMSLQEISREINAWNHSHSPRKNQAFKEEP